MPRAHPPGPQRLTELLNRPLETAQPLPPAASGRWTPAVPATEGLTSRSQRRHPRVIQVPAALAGMVTRPGWLAVLGFALVLVVAAVIVAVRTGNAVSAAAPTPLATGPVRLSTPGGGSASSPVPSGSQGGTPVLSRSTPGGSAGPSGQVTVHVVGRVARPGVVRLPAGARLQDAVAAAGGSARRADLAAVNLARPLTDGEQVYIPAVGEPGRSASGAPSSGGRATGSRPPGTSGPGASSRGAGGPSGTNAIDLNTADAPTLESLPGVGPVLADRIVQWRRQHGRFTSVEELAEVPGIGDKLLARISPQVRV